MKLDPKTACPLSPALVLLLQSCLDGRSTHDKKLAERLFLSAETVHTQFKLIAQRLDTHDRFEAVLIAMDKGWITFTPTPPPPPLKSRLQKIYQPDTNNHPNWGIASGTGL